MIELPNDTIFESDPIPGLSGEALQTFKFLILRLAEKIDLQYSNQTETINEIEKLRRKGYLKIVSDDRETFRLQLTPIGGVAVWLHHNGSDK